MRVLDEAGLALLNDLSAAAVARALMEQGSTAIFQLIAAIEDENQEGE